ncbi:alpha/beta fold hydrolase, partial [Pseudotabrizicola sp.]|uniref:alpha/beta fold hydrolase n=1 Tax=Pseudotabrizicola sp. TaxID=2939647 RepID=UPI00271B076F
HMQIAGSGPDLVMIHGANGNLREFTFALMAQLSDRYRVIAVDRPGLGYSDPLPGNDASTGGQARVLRQAMAQIGVENPIVLGQSYGGTVALSWALQAPPAALVLVSSPSLPWPGDLDPWYRITATPVGRATLVPLASALVADSYVRRAIDGVFAPQSPPKGYADHLGIGLTLRRKSMATNVSQINGLRPQVEVMQRDYPSLILPIELVHGDADTIVPLHIHSAPLMELIPNGALTVLPGAGHMPHHTHPNEVIAAIDRVAVRAGLRGHDQ